MFKKLMAMIKSPKNVGGGEPRLGNNRWVKTYDVILSNMEGAPSYPLTHQLAIGSEIGNIIIADPSVSPRHASILLQEEVISIIDHGSVSGTFVNGTKIPPGKFIILEDTDKISVGDLEVKLGIKTSSIDNTSFAPPGFEHLDEDDDSEEENEEETEESEEEEDEDIELEEEEEVVPETEKTVTKSKLYMGKGKPAQPLSAFKPKSKFKLNLSMPSYDATNSIVRVLALIGDLLLSYIIIVIFLPFDDFRNFLNSVPSLVAETLDFEWINLWEMVAEDAGQVTDVLKEVYLIVNEVVPVLPLIQVFFIIRLVTTIIFAVSISEFLFGIHANFNKIWARIGGMLRVIIGMITWPFLIFDLPALFSKRTFKEFITVTNTYVGSRVMTFVGIVLYLPLLVLLILVSPMMIGLELVEPIPFSTIVSKRVKAVATETEAATPEPVVQKKSEGSRHLGMTLTYDPQKISLIPSFKFKGDKSKLNMNASLEVFDREGERTITVDLFKKFDMKELLKIGLQGNFMLHDHYTQIYNFAYSAQNMNRFFKVSDNVKQEEMFGKQVVDFTEMAFGLGIETLPDFMMTNTPFIKSIVDYRSSLMGLFEYKDYTEINVIKLGKILCLRLTYDQQKPFDLIMPIVRGEGRIYRISYDNKTDIKQLRNKVYKFTLDEMTWGVPEERENVETFQSMEVIDMLTTDIEKAMISTQKAQSLYGYYFEKSAEVMKSGHMAEYEIWKQAVKSLQAVIPHLRVPVPEASPVEGMPVAEDVKGKLKSNFTDLFNALENKSKSFFGIEEQPTI
ncbi:MAG: FHA domain-containing protein [Bdellovibrionota bacterium]